MRSIRNVVKAIIIREERLLVTYHISPEEVYYSLPGGGQEIAETLTEALKRECVEEIGVQVDVGELLYVRENIEPRHRETAIDNGLHKVEFFFACTIHKGDNPSVGHQPDSHQVDVIWMPLRDVEQYQLYPLALRSTLKQHLSKINKSVYLGEGKLVI